MLADITPVILAFNEAPNLQRTLQALSWAHRVVILDSGSTDNSRAIAGAFANVEWHERAFDEHAKQCNFALDQLVPDASWVLFMDSDYVVTDDLRRELAELQPSNDVNGYAVPFRYCIDGVPLRGTLYPPRVSLFRPARGRYRQIGHTQWLELDGTCGALTARMLHDDRKPSANFIKRQRRYAELEAKHLLSTTWSEMSLGQRVRRLMIIAPWAVPAFVLFGKGLILDGVPGLKYAWERTQAECLIAFALARQSFFSRKKFSA